MNNFIKIYESAISIDLCTQILCMLEKGKWNRSLVYSNEDQDNLRAVESDKRTSDSFDKTQDFYHKIYSIIHPIISEKLFDYIQNFEVELNSRQEALGYNILRYKTGQQTVLHCDDGRVGVHRKVSGLLYLNEDFTGGELFFNKLNINYSPKSGDILFFPSSFPFTHEAKKVESGTKYCVVRFWN